jgi:hypothetical protein
MAPEGEAQLHQPHTRPAHSCLVGPPKSRTILPSAAVAKYDRAAPVFSDDAPQLGGNRIAKSIA